MMFGLFGPSFDPKRDIQDLSGKVYVVTGGNAGLGKETVRQLAKHNPQKIYLAARDQAKGEQAIADIQKDVPDAKIAFLSLDLASLKSVKAAAESVNSSTERLDVLINNAGIMATPPGLTQEGYEIQFGTNHVGHFLFTKLLLPLLEKTAAQENADVRIVNLTSIGHKFAPRAGVLFNGKLETEMASYETFVRYGQSKLANILFTRELAQRYPKIRTVAIHPGAVDTNLSLPIQNTWSWISPVLMPIFKTFVLQTAEKGALNQIWAATSPDVKTGTYYVPVASENAGSKLSRNVDLAKELWDWSEKEVVKHRL